MPSTMTAHNMNESLRCIMSCLSRANVMRIGVRGCIIQSFHVRGKE